jgi:site-specific DNA recombinase
MTKRAVLYARVSKDDRGNDGRNLAGQLDMCREYAESHGYTVVAELQEDDRGASGAEIDLPQLNRVREMARAGQFHALIVREIDRLSRNLAKQLIIEDELKRAGVRIEYVIGEYPDTPEGSLMKHIKASIAEYERLKITERNLRGRRLAVQRGNVMIHSRAPYGYISAELNGKPVLAIYEPEARIIRLIFTWYVEGDDETGRPLSLYRIIHKLNEMGAPSPGQVVRRKMQEKRSNHPIEPLPATPEKLASGKWSKSSLHTIIRSETYAGTWHYGKIAYSKQERRKIRHAKEQWLSVSVPPIISREMWEAAQARLAENRASMRRNATHEYLLARHVVCKCCKRKMSGAARGGKYLYYRCLAAYPSQNYERTCSLRTGFRADHVDATVWQWIHAFLKDRETLRAELDKSRARLDETSRPTRERIAVIDDLLADNREQLERVLDLYQHDKSKKKSNKMLKDALVDRVDRLQNVIEKLEAERSASVTKLEALTLTADDVRDIETSAVELVEAVEMADSDFEAQRYIIHKLRLEAMLTVENGEKVIYAECLLGKKRLSLLSSTTSNSARPRRANKPAPAWRQCAPPSSAKSPASAQTS